MKYIDLISKGAEEEKKEELKFRAEEAQLAVTQSLLETRKELSKKKRELLKSQSAMPYDLQNEISLQQEIEALENVIERAELIASERF